VRTTISAFTQVVALGLASCGASSSDVASAPLPNLTGLWAREFLEFEPPESGLGPVANLARIPTGQSDLDHPVGNYKDPNLKPAAAEVLKRRGEVSLSGKNFPQPSNQCAPHPMPYILYQWQIQLIQLKDEVVILYQSDHHVRHVRLNAQHPTKVTPSWSGDSVGRYEGDTLIVDTIGVKVGRLSMSDIIGTPQSEAVHVVERYRLVPYETAIEAFKNLEKEHIHILPQAEIGDGIAIDRDYRGLGLQLQFTVEDPDVFNEPWSATSTFLKAAGEWSEYVCAENTREYYANEDTAIPTSNKPDF
jgi:hypothetical protein